MSFSIKRSYIPIQIDENVVAVKPAETVGILDMAINSTCVMTDNKDNLNKIQEKSNSLQLFTYDFVSFSQQLDNIIQQESQNIYLISIALFLILLFCVVTLISNFLHFIQAHKRELVIHMMCGAKISAFVMRMAIQVIVLLILGNILVFPIFINQRISLVIALFSIMLGLLILLWPIISLMRQNINDLLKRSE